MKKIVMGLVVLVGVFVLWSGIPKNVIEKIPVVEKKLKVKEELFFKSDELISEPIEEGGIAKQIEVNIGVDVNITKENNVTLTVNIKESNSTYDYVWKENENIVGLGKVLTKAYDKGEHLLTVEVLGAGEVIGADEVKITAWDYLKIEKMYHYGENEFNVFEKKIYDHHHWLLLLEHPVYAKTTYLYNEAGKVLEEKYEAFNDDNRSYTLLYTYDEEENLLSMERLDIDENIVESIFYDENGEVIVLAPKEKKELSASENYIDNSIKTYNEKNQLIKRESNSDDYKFLETMKYKDEKLVLKERFTDSGHYIFKYEHNKDGKTTLRKSTKRDNDSNTVWMNSVKTEYNKDGRVIKQERKNVYKDEVQTHVVQHWSYKNEKVVEHEIEALEGICPCTSDVIKEKTVYIYNSEGELLQKQYQSQKENEEELQKEETSMKVVRTYTNIL